MRDVWVVRGSVPGDASHLVAPDTPPHTIVMDPFLFPEKLSSKRVARKIKENIYSH
jgi:hypothetical protein